MRSSVIRKNVWGDFVQCKVNFGDVYRRKFFGGIRPVLLVTVNLKICYKFLGSILSRGIHLSMSFLDMFGLSFHIIQSTLWRENSDLSWPCN